MKDRQAQIIDKLSDRIALPNMSATRERELLTKLYDTLEEITGEVISAL